MRLSRSVRQPDPVQPSAALTACSAASLAAGETLAGKAPTARYWVLLESAAPWPRRAEDAALPAPARAALLAQLSRLPSSRLQLVRPPRRPAKGVRLLLADTVAGTLAQRDLENLDELADVDLADPGAPGWTEWAGPLFLVCLHARRDTCCGTLGPPIWRALEGRFPGCCRQSTHVGGHRFAPNLVALPQGYVFSRLTPETAVRAADAFAAGTLDLESCRGRAALEPRAQAAELHLRARSGRLRLDDDAWPDEVTVREVPLGVTAPESCGGPPVPVVNYVVEP